jgi:immunity protein, SdpI family
MNYLNPIFFIPATTGLLIIIIGLLMLKFPPKKINLSYGYRTGSSMKTEERWAFAQKFSAKEMMKLGGILTLTCTIGFILNVNEGIGTAIGLGLMILFFIVPLIRTERAIKFKFGKE